VVVCGVEAHVCVLQTCLDLIDAGYVTAVVTDAIGSRRPTDQDAAVQRMIQAGVVPTTVESILMEFVHEAGTPRFKAVLPIIK
jgi:nicotinamidase-related amidase